MEYTDWARFALEMAYYCFLVEFVASCPDDCRCSESESLGLLVNCSDLGFTVIPRNLPLNTTALDLSRNHIHPLNSYSFAGLSQLRWLDVSDNGIGHISKEAFQGLITLKTLSLRKNALNFYEISPNLFKPLSNLEVLDIRNNFDVGGYPLDMWQHLTNLRELHLDAPLYKFNSGFLVLKKLRALSFSGAMVDINADTFEGLRLSPIEKLDLEGCIVKYFEGQAFRYLPSLTWLSVANIPLEWQLRNMSSGFDLISLQHLDLNRTISDVRAMPTLLSDACQWGSTLKSFTVSNDHIHDLGGMMSTCFPKLEVFSCSYNYIFEHTRNILDLLNMSNIRVLDMSWQKTTPKKSDVRSRKTGSFRVREIAETQGIFPIDVASTLEILDVSHNHLPQIPEILLLTHVNLRIIRAVEAGISTITKPIHCRYPPVIHEIDAMNNSMNFVHQDVFKECNWTSILKLNMSGNMLGELLQIQGPKPFFKPLAGLMVRRFHVVLAYFQLIAFQGPLLQTWFNFNPSMDK